RVLMPKSGTAIACIVGIYKADCICVPLDTSCPPSRLAKMIASADSEWILAAGPVTTLLDQIWQDERIRTSISVGWRNPEPGARGNSVRLGFTLDDVRSYPGARSDY